MLEFFRKLFQTDFWPHGQCYLWKPEVLWLHVVSDLLIAASYLLISAFLWHFSRNRRDIPYRWIFSLFALFIVACGVTHFMEVWTVWHPVYRLSGLVKLVTAGASAATAAAMVWLLPKVIGLPTYAAAQLSLLDLVHDAISISDLGDVIQLWNHGAELTYGWSRAEAVGCVGRELLRARLPQTPDEIRARLLTHAHWEGEIRHTHRNGAVLTMASHWALQRDEKGRPSGVLQISRDISAIKEAQAELDRFFSLSSDLLCIAGFDGFLKRLNPAWEHSLDFSREELLSRPFIELIHPQDRLSTEEQVGLLGLGTPTIMFENRYVCKDGFVKWFSWNAIPNTQEGVIYAVGRDITNRKSAELGLQDMKATLERRVKERTAELLAANQEMEAFSYSVSHDLRAPLRQIASFARILGEHIRDAPDSEARHYLQRIQAGATHMGRLVEDLLHLSQVGRLGLRLELTNLNDLVAEVVESLQAETSGRNVEWILDPLPCIACDPVLMRSVFSNLLSNAVKFTSKREQAVIRVGQRTENGETALFVADNGVGFQMKYADKLFGIFQRLHRAVEFPGTGVGLATVQRIIRKHGGRIWVQAELDMGATFHFTLAAEGKEPAEDCRQGREVTCV